MVDPKHIPYLIKLLDDDSEEIQQDIVKELSAFGPKLSEELQRLDLLLNPRQRSHLQSIIAKERRVRLRHRWSSWYRITDEFEKLEKCLILLSEYLNPAIFTPQLSNMLDALALAYRERHARIDPILLAQFLFLERGLKGDEENYYNPQNSNLYYVIQQKKGIPISLACVYMLVGKRLNLDIDGCLFPGHFLGRVKTREKTCFVDCFNAGQVINEKDLVDIKEDMVDDIRAILYEKFSAENLARRYLANLVRAFEVQEDDDECQLMVDLFKDIDHRLSRRRFETITPEEIIRERKTRYKPGQLVRHKRYGYRGIIVDIDPCCQATDSWYYGNQTQPDKDQPWLHVLVDGTEQVTYVAESNLVKEESSHKISHPLISYFFKETGDGRYVRNDNPWPNTDF